MLQLFVRGLFASSTEFETAYGAQAWQFDRWILFSPFMCMTLIIDLQFVMLCSKYKPVTFVNLPHRYCREICTSFALISLFSSIICIILSFFSFARPPGEIKRSWFYLSIQMKGFTWAPFIAHEFYDMVFEQIYLDAQY
jgi:hypothetical protein